MTEPTELDLLKAIQESLDKDGSLCKIKGSIRAAIMNLLITNRDKQEFPVIPQETRLINELIREYLAWNGYEYTEQVLTKESGQTNDRLTRDVLTAKFGVLDDARTSKIPLLYYIVSSFNNIQEDE